MAEGAYEEEGEAAEPPFTQSLTPERGGARPSGVSPEGETRRRPSRWRRAITFISVIYGVRGRGAPKDTLKGFGGEKMGQSLEENLHQD